MEPKRIKVLIGKPGLDGHDRGAKVVAIALRNAGMEVIYTGLHQSPEQIVQAAIDEDVDVIGLSILSGIHVSASRKIMDLLEKEGVKDDFTVIVGGTISNEDEIKQLKEMGVAGVFPVQTRFEEIINFLNSSQSK